MPIIALYALTIVGIIALVYAVMSPRLTPAKFNIVFYLSFFTVMSAGVATVVLTPEPPTWDTGMGILIFTLVAVAVFIFLPVDESQQDTPMMGRSESR